MKQSSNKAFSLIELSIVLLVIGIIVAGITQSSRLINQSKLVNAQTMTQSSPVSSIKDIILWVETTQTTSFKDSEVDDGKEILTWYDYNPQTTIKSSFTGTAGTAPLYRSQGSSLINGLPILDFSIGSRFMTNTSFSGLSGTSATLFFVGKLPSTISAQVILSKRPSAAFASSAPNIQFSTAATGTGWKYCDGATQTTNATNCNYGATATVTASANYVISVVYNSNSSAPSGNTATGISFFQNGVLSGQFATTSFPANNSDSLFVGKHGSSDSTSGTFFNGSIGEIIIFNRALNKEERQSVEQYLGKKWGIIANLASI